MRDFNSLEVWKRAHALRLEMHRVVRQFPKRGFGRLIGQLTGSADSIADTIAEGCGAASGPEFARFLDMSMKSASETENHLIAARDRGSSR